MSTQLYKDAILEAKKLKELAEEDAKKQIMEQLAPMIKKHLTEQLNSPEQFFLEQDDELETPVIDPSAAPAAPAVDATVPEPNLSVSTDTPLAAPISEPGEALGVSMPDEDGRITVDFEDLFKPAGSQDMSAAPVAPAAPAEPMPTDGSALPAPTDPMAPGLETGDGGESLELTPPAEGLEEPMEDLDAPLTTGEAVSFNGFRKSLLEVSEKIDEIYFSGNKKEIVLENLKIQLFSLVDQLDYLKENELIDNKKLNLNENRLQFLYSKLKEAKMHNSYIQPNHKKEEIQSMTSPSLKQLAAKLFMEDTTASAKHAAKVSGVAPEVDLHEESNPGATGTVDAEPLPGVKQAKEMQHADGEAALDEKSQDKVIEEALESLSEEIEAEGHAGFGDTTEKPEVEFDVNEKELMEAIKEYKKNKAAKKLAESKKESWEDAAPEGGTEPAQDHLKEEFEVDFADFSDEEEGTDSALPGDEMSSMDSVGDEVIPGDDMDMDVGTANVNVDMDEELMAALDDAGLGDIDIDISLADVVEDISSEDEPMGSVDAVDSANPVVDDSENKEVFEAYEKKLSKLGKALRESIMESRESKKQVDALKNELKESNLFLAKNVFFTKVLQRGDVSRKNLEHVVEYLDKAKTVSEAKSIYNKIKNKLNESASRKLAGSASKVTMPGSAVTTLTEGVARRDNESFDGQTTERWQQLAGIKK